MYDAARGVGFQSGADAASEESERSRGVVLVPGDFFGIFLLGRFLFLFLVHDFFRSRGVVFVPGDFSHLPPRAFPLPLPRSRLPPLPRSRLPPPPLPHPRLPPPLPHPRLPPFILGSFLLPPPSAPATSEASPSGCSRPSNAAMSSSSPRDKPSFEVAAPSLGSCAFKTPRNVASSSRETPRGRIATSPGLRNIPTAAIAEPASASVATSATEARNTEPRVFSPPSARGSSKRARSPTIAVAGFDACVIARVSGIDDAKTTSEKSAVRVFKDGNRENPGSVLECPARHIAHLGV